MNDILTATRYYGVNKDKYFFTFSEMLNDKPQYLNVSLLLFMLHALHVNYLNSIKCTSVAVVFPFL